MTSHRRALHEGGFTLIELLVVVIIIGILAGVAIPVFMNQKAKAADASVQSDIKSYSTALETAFGDANTYPAAGAIALGAASSGNAYRVFTVPSGPAAGYVIYGKAKTSPTVWAFSSWLGGMTKTTLTDVPSSPPAPSELGLPAGITVTSWGGIGGFDPTGVETVTRLPFQDAQLITTVKPTFAAPNPLNIGSKHGARYQIIDMDSPVSTRAIQVQTVSATQDDGVFVRAFNRAATGPSWFPTVAGAGEKWTTSAWVKATTPGTLLHVGARIAAADGTYVVEDRCAAVATTGQWQRIVCTMTSAGSWVGNYVSLNVYTPTVAPGTEFFITGPQIDQGPVASPFDVRVP